MSLYYIETALPTEVALVVAPWPDVIGIEAVVIMIFWEELEF